MELILHKPASPIRPFKQQTFSRKDPYDSYYKAGFVYWEEQGIKVGWWPKDFTPNIFHYVGCQIRQYLELTDLVDTAEQAAESEIEVSKLSAAELADGRFELGCFAYHAAILTFKDPGKPAQFIRSTHGGTLYQASYLRSWILREVNDATTLNGQVAVEVIKLQNGMDEVQSRVDYRGLTSNVESAWPGVEVFLNQHAHLFTPERFRSLVEEESEYLAYLASIVGGRTGSHRR